MSSLEHNKAYPRMSETDARQWFRIESDISMAKITSDVWSLLDLQGAQGVIIGPGLPPNDALQFQMAYSLGLQGTLYSADPQGDVQKGRNGIIVGVGNSNQCERDVRVLKEVGVPLSDLHWLGTSSVLDNLPVEDHSLDVVADHTVYEFLGSDPQVDANYIQRGLLETIRCLRIGGLFIHQSIEGESLLAADAMGFDEQTMIAWLEWNGLRTVSSTLQEDSYWLPISADSYRSMFASDIPELVFTPDAAKDVRFASVNQQALVIPASCIAYPSTRILIAQKVW